MNRTNFEHAFFAVLMQCAIGFATGNWWAGAAFGSAFFIGREHAQYEKKITHGGPVNDLNPLAGFSFWNWSLDARLDLLFPVVATVVISVFLNP